MIKLLSNYQDKNLTRIMMTLDVIRKGCAIYSTEINPLRTIYCKLVDHGGSFLSDSEFKEIQGDSENNEINYVTLVKDGNTFVPTWSQVEPVWNPQLQGFYGTGKNYLSRYICVRKTDKKHDQFSRFRLLPASIIILGLRANTNSNGFIKFGTAFTDINLEWDYDHAIIKSNGFYKICINAISERSLEASDINRYAYVYINGIKKRKNNVYKLLSGDEIKFYTPPQSNTPLIGDVNGWKTSASIIRLK